MTALEELGHLSDLPMQVEVELDRKIMSVRAILAIENGSVIKMQRSAGENMMILVGGVPVGSGEIVIVDETVGIRITDFKQED
jgi:flagellar motor switch protein FliN/FliY